MWIPCTPEEYNKPRDEAWKEKQYWYNGGEWGDSQPTEIGSPSIEKYKGFYVARYEAGIPEEAPFYASQDGNTYYTDTPLEQDEKKIIKNVDSYTAVSEKGKPAWNFINQTNAKTVAGKMVDNESVKSYLIDSHAWDTICRVIQKYEGTKNLTASTTWGNYLDNDSEIYNTLNTLFAPHSYSGGEWTFASQYQRGNVSEYAPKGDTGSTKMLELSTGATDKFKAFNIYDLAGNMWEWTTENGINPSSNKPNDPIPTIASEDVEGATNAVIRGGSFGDSGGDCPVVYSNSSATTGYGVGIGFRAVLYLK